MNNELPDTPDLSRYYCPGCEPEADPSREILVVRWCFHHGPGMAGADDEAVRVNDVGIGTGSDADGANCRAAQGVIR